MKRKFELTDETVTAGHGAVLYRIRAVEDIPLHCVRKGDLGGFVEKIENLSGNAWVFDDAQVYGYAQVFGDAQVSDDAQVYGDARVYGDSHVYGDARVYGYAQVFGGARVSGYARVSGDALVYGDGHLTEARHVQQVIGIGSEGRTATFFRTLGGGHILNIGCWSGNIQTLMEEVARRRGVYWEAEESTKDAWVEQYDALKLLCEVTMKLWGTE